MRSRDLRSSYRWIGGTGSDRDEENLVSTSRPLDSTATEGRIHKRLERRVVEWVDATVYEISVNGRVTRQLCNRDRSGSK